MATAARNLLWASSLSGSTERSERLLVEAGLAFVDAGQSPRAAMLRAQLESCRESPTRSLVLGLIDWELGDVASAEHWLGNATEGRGGEGNELIAARAWAQLAEIHVVQGRGQDAVDAARRALASGERNTQTERLAWIHQSVGEAMLHGGPAGLDLLSQRLPADPVQIPGREVDMLVNRATLAYYSARPMSALADLRAVLDLVRRGSVPVQLARCHFLMASILTNRGDWDEALIHARTALAVASDDQLVWTLSQCHAALGTVLAYRGEWEGAEHHVARASAMAVSHENLEAMGTARLAAAALARARNEPDRVIDELASVASFAPGLSALHFWPPLIHALIDTNRTDEAQEQATRLSRAADERRINLDNRLRLIRARLAAASGQPEMAVTLFDEARKWFGPDDSFLDRVVLHQSYGRLLHSRGDRRRGIDELRIALKMVTGVGAKPFMAHVEADLATFGSPSAPKSVSRSTLDLTDRERDVAVLVAQGMSNPEVADRLYVSRKAIEFHLGNIYGKLGITSRRELRSKQFSF
jgi:DNA-binding CsgD family transcriptional regulator